MDLKNYEKAKEYFELAVLQNDSDAMMLLGHLYLNGDGVKRDPNKAHKYYLNAIQNGVNHVIYDIIEMYKRNHDLLIEFIKNYNTLESENARLLTENEKLKAVILYQSGEDGYIETKENE